MKNIFKYSVAIALMAVGLASCEEMPDYQTTIDAAPDFIYVNPQGGDIFSTVVVHRPDGSEGSYTAEFQVKYNTAKHEEVTAAVVYAPELVEEYNLKNGTSYAVLAKDYFTLENDTVTVPADTTASRDTVRIILNESADLSALTEPAYLAPFTVMADGAAVSENLGAVWFVVNTEVNLIRPLESINDMVGFPAGGVSAWTADCDAYENLFDDNTSTNVPFSYSETNVLIIDMKEVNKVTGIRLNTYLLSGMSIEYSEDGNEWHQAGTPLSGEYVWTGSSYGAGDWCVALADYVSARYLRLSYRMSVSYSGYNNIRDIQVYVTEGSSPAVYAMTGSDNVVTGRVTHKSGAESYSTFTASFPAYVTEASESGYTVTAAGDASLVSAYNQKYGTSYVALPAENLDITVASVTVAAGETVSAESISVALTGDMNSLTDSEGYLAAVKLSASGAVSSASRGAVYFVIRPENNVIKDLDSAADIIGFQASRTGWTATANGASTTALFDNSTSTRVNCNQTGNVLVVNMNGVHNVSGFSINGYPVSNVSVEYSTDGSTWDSAGTAASEEIVFTGRNANSSGDTYVGFVEPLEASSLRLTFDAPNTSSSRRRIYEFNVIEVDSTDPTVYTICGTDNVFTGAITHHTVAGTFGNASASFTPMVTHPSEAGYDVVALMDNSYIDDYNAAHGTSYSEINPSYVEISGMITKIEAGATQASEQVKVSLKGDLSSLTDKNGYLIPVKLVTSGALTSEKKGVVYLAVNVAESDAKFMSGFTAADITGTLVADRSGWSIVACDAEGVHSGSYEELFDDKTATYVRTWGGPVSFTVDLGQEVEMSGLQITARTDNNSYASYQPNSIQIMSSLDGESYTDMGTVAYSEGTIYRTTPTSYVGLYVPEKVRYLKIEASYGSNMGAGDFNIYVK